MTVLLFFNQRYIELVKIKGEERKSVNKNIQVTVTLEQYIALQ